MPRNTMGISGRLLDYPRKRKQLAVLLHGGTRFESELPPKSVLRRTLRREWCDTAQSTNPARNSGARSKDQGAGGAHDWDSG